MTHLKPQGAVHRGSHLAMGWSPEQIAGRLRLEEEEHTINHESIYGYVCRPDVRRMQRLHRYLPQAKTKRGRRYFKRQRDPIPHALNIANRPQVIEERSEFGHWEGDLLQFRSQQGNALTLLERVSRFTLIRSQQTKQAEPTAEAIAEALRHLPKAARKSITFDRGTEFAAHENISNAIGTDIWFCDPHSPWQRGAIENTNGVIRRDMPRKSDIKEYTQQDIRDIIWAINTTPRKCLDFRTPAEVFIQKLNGALQL